MLNCFEIGAIDGTKLMLENYKRHACAKWKMPKSESHAIPKLIYFIPFGNDSTSNGKDTQFGIGLSATCSYKKTFFIFEEKGRVERKITRFALVQLLLFINVVRANAKYFMNISEQHPNTYTTKWYRRKTAVVPFPS